MFSTFMVNNQVVTNILNFKHYCLFLIKGLLSRISLTLSLTTVLLNLEAGCFSLLCSFLICVRLEDVQVLHLLTQQWFLYAIILGAMPTRCSKALQQTGKGQWAGVTDSSLTRTGGTNAWKQVLFMTHAPCWLATWKKNCAGLSKYSLAQPLYKVIACLFPEACWALQEGQAFMTYCNRILCEEVPSLLTTVRI